jgi:hypothetical protein
VTTLAGGLGGPGWGVVVAAEADLSRRHWPAWDWASREGAWIGRGFEPLLAQVQAGEESAVAEECDFDT